MPRRVVGTSAVDVGFASEKGMPQCSGPARLSARESAAVVLAALFFLVGFARQAIVLSAKSEARGVGEIVRASAQSLMEADRMLEQARQRHFSRYLQGVSTADGWSALKDAERFLENALQSRSPNEIRRLAAQAEAAANKASDLASSVRTKTAALDEALRRFRSAPDQANSAVRGAEETISRLVGMGYRPAHFGEARRVLSQGAELERQARLVSRKIVERGLPDYLSVFELSVRAEDLAREARRIALGVQALRSENASRIDRLSARIRSAASIYPRARECALYLLRYEAYTHFAGSVSRGIREIASAERMLPEAQRLNSMEVQRFQEAASILSRAERLVGDAEEGFQQAVRVYSAVLEAEVLLAAVSAEAERLISLADARISRYSHNNQSRAERYLGDAKRSLSSGRLLVRSDPISALQQYRTAVSLARHAFNAVDTSSRTGPSGGEHWGRFGGSHGGSGGGPSGGFSGGPSGGFSGGPSGGGFGGGGF